ncbi:MAG: PAS domain-containing protein [Planctomycetia bacterium]|nr:PAS domain-containing protein [Planctomycetia bacterium]
MDTDRNLLAGVLAVQADLIDRQQFIEACLLWAGRKSVPLVDLLIERKWIVEADRSHLEYLVNRKLALHSGDSRASLAGAPEDLRRSLAAIDDVEIRNSVAALPSRPDRNVAETTIFSVGAESRYERGALHATGGIGRVWKAEDRTLGRIVALKELRPERAADDALRAQTEILKSILQSMADGVVVADSDGHFILWNPAADRMVGIGITSAPTDEWSDRYGCFLPDGKTLYPPHELPLARAMRGELVDDVEVIIRNAEVPEGRVLSVNATPLRDADGKSGGSVAVFRDITERKHAEQAVQQSETLYFSLLEKLPLLVTRKDLDGRFTFGNRRFCDEVGKSPEEILGMTDFDFYPPDFAAKYRADDRRVVESGKSLETIEDHVEPGGEKLVVQVIKTPIFEAEQHVIAVQCVCWDVRAQQRLQQELAAMKNEVVELREQLERQTAQRMP